MGLFDEVSVTADGILFGETWCLSYKIVKENGDAEVITDL